MALVFTDSSHRYQMCIICNDHDMLQYSIPFGGFLMLVGLRLMPNVLQGAW
jgi:hypothetical protein